MRQIDRHVLSLHEQINDLRSKHHLRILWPDYECYSLLQASVKVETLPWYVSAQGTLKIVQIPKSSLLTSEVILDDFTHLCISNYKAYGKSNEEETMLALIFSNRSFAVDSISLRQTGENSHPIILIQLDETNLKIRLWGCGLIA